MSPVAFCIDYDAFHISVQTLLADSELQTDEDEGKGERAERGHRSVLLQPGPHHLDEARTGNKSMKSTPR